MTYRQVVQRIRVPSGFVMLPVLILSARSTKLSLVVGAVMAIVGLVIRGWASGYLRKNQELTTSGPYGYTRNPLYFGTLFLGAGAAIAGGTLWFIALFVAFYLAIYSPVIFAEAETMRRMFPESYESYSRQVPLFLPRLRPPPSSGPGPRFERSLYMKHREYQAAMGFLLVYAILIAKYLWTVG
jgi:protein-S-isoprenylcysteine O-methyltransferase Ste14